MRFLRFVPLLVGAASLGGAAEPALREVPGAAGAMVIPFTMPAAGTATVGIYTKEGRLLRPLVQSVELPQGAHTVRWDGMDLFGNVLPAGNELEVRVFSGPGLRAKWEFAIASPSAVPWPTKAFGEGEAMRAGGWLGDHGTSASAVAVGERIFFGSTMAEHGHTVIFTNLHGEKMWGRGGLEGWRGPRMLASDGTAVFGVVEKNHLHRVELSGESSKQIADTGEDEIVGLAAHAGRVVLTLKNHEFFGSLVAPEVGGKDLDFGRCLPVPSGAKAYNRNLTEQEQFARTFFEGGHPQTGISPAVNAANAATAGIVAKFKKPMEVGTLLVERMALAVDAEVYVCKAGTAWSAPVPGNAPDAAWQLVGKSDLARRLNAISGTEAILADAVYIRLKTRDGAAPKNWPRLTMCRLFPRLLERVELAAASVAVPAGGGVKDAGVHAGDLSWSFRASEAITAAAPAAVLLDLKTEAAFDALVLQNCVNHQLAVDAWKGKGTPSLSGEGWEEIGLSHAGTDQALGSRAATTFSNDRRISLTQTVTTRALRVRLLSGMDPGRWMTPMNVADPARSDCADVTLLRLRGTRPKVPEMMVQIRDGLSGAVLVETKDASAAMTAIVFDAKGKLTSVMGSQLFRSVLPEKSGAPVRHTAMSAATGLKNPISLAVAADGSRIAVGDAGAMSVFLFDGSGKPNGTIGGIGPRKRGPWNPNTVELPCAVTIDKNGKIWVCERTYSPKRVTRYSSAGQFERELLGPPHYGGGGWLDPNLKSFWYEGGEYAVDFAAGSSRLKTLADVQKDPATPTLEKGSYSYTKVGRPVYHGGHRYIVGDSGGQFSPGGYVICLYDDGQTSWRPVAVMGKAQGSEFLTRADKPWSAHWLSRDLANASFIWCDLNEDGAYQIEEVQLFKNTEVMGADRQPFDAPYWGCLSGQDLTFWGNSRLAPTRFTPKGVPVFEKAKIQAFTSDRLAVFDLGNVLANSSAKGSYGGVSMVARDGTLVLEGQPWRVRPDFTIVGGPVSEKPSDFLPRIAGKRLDNPLSFIGSAATKSPVGEVAMLNGNNGNWFLWAVEHGVVLGEIFTGNKGGFGAVTNVTRGMDVTAYKQDWETFFGNFVGGQDGSYYVVAGRGHWGVSRVEGIDEIRMAKQTLRITPEAFAKNTELRPQLAALAKVSGKKREKRQLAVPVLTTRTKNFVLDGELSEWGKAEAFQKIGDAGSFVAAWDAQVLTLAWSGSGSTANGSEDWRYLFKTGFCLDLSLRANAAEKGEAYVAGDRRIVIGRHKGKWVAVLHDFVLANGAAAEMVNFTSPVTSTRVERVALLPESAVRIAVKEAAGSWSAEVQLAWSALGITPAGEMQLRADVGILNPDTAGVQVDRRTNWSDPGTGHVADLAVEAQIHPVNFGSLVLQP